MTNRLIRKKTVLTRFVPAVLVTLLLGAFMLFDFIYLDAFSVEGSFFLDLVSFLMVLFLLIFFGIKNLFLFFGGVRLGNGKKCIKDYDIDIKDLNEDMKNAANVDNLYVGSKYFLCADKKPVIMPLERLIVVHPRTLVLFGEAYDDLEVYANSSHILLTDDCEKTRPFPTAKKKQRVEERVEHLKDILKLFQNADPAILTPLDHEYWEWLNRFNENIDRAKKIVDKKREDAVLSGHVDNN